MQYVTRQLYLSIYFCLVILLFFVNIVWGGDEIILNHAQQGGYSGDKEGTITLLGNVELQYKEFSMGGDWVEINLGTKEIFVKDNVVVGYKTNELRGNELQYNYEKMEGHLNEVSCVIEPIYCHSEELYFMGTETILLKEAAFTTCNHRPPHYELHTPSLTVHLNKSISAKNIVLTVGKVPVFYLPYYYSPLKESLFPFDLKGGYSEDWGIYLRSGYNYFLTPNSSGKLYLDYFQNRGVGFGDQHNYIFGEKTTEGKLYLYGINEDNSEFEDFGRWDVELSHYQILPYSLKIMGYLHQLSDPEVGREYRNTETRSDEIERYLNIESARSNWVLRLVCRTDQLWDGGKFSKIDEYLPQINFQTTPLKINKSPIYSYGQLIFNRAYDDTYEDFFTSSKAEINFGGESIWPSEQIGITPSLGISTEWNEENEDSPLQEVHSQLCLRGKISPNFETTLTHLISHQMNDDNLVYNRLNNVLNLSLSPVLKARLSMGYNLKEHHSEIFELVCNILPSQHWNGAINVTYNPYLDFFEEISTSQTISWHKLNLALKFLYGDSLLGDDISEINGEIGWRFNPGSKVEIMEYYNLNTNKTTRIELSIYKLLHCWETRWEFVQKREMPSDELTYNFSFKIEIGRRSGG